MRILYGIIEGFGWHSSGSDSTWYCLAPVPGIVGLGLGVDLDLDPDLDLVKCKDRYAGDRPCVNEPNHGFYLSWFSFLLPGNFEGLPGSSDQTLYLCDLSATRAASATVTMACGSDVFSRVGHIPPRVSSCLPAARQLVERIVQSFWSRQCSSEQGSYQMFGCPFLFCALCHVFILLGRSRWNDWYLQPRMEVHVSRLETCAARLEDKS